MRGKALGLPYVARIPHLLERGEALRQAQGTLFHCKAKLR